MNSPLRDSFSKKDGGRKPPYEWIKSAILDETFAPGDPLVESTLAKMCGVSRTPIREALTRLEQDGLVVRGDRGLIVRMRSPEEILDIYETRVALESTAARVAAERHSPLDRIRLEHLLQVAEEADPQDVGLLAERNRDFHHGVWLASRNETLIDLLRRLDMHLIRYPATTLSHPGRWARALKQHRAIVEAIVKRDVKAAAELAQQHFEEARDIRLELWEKDLT